MNSTGYTYDDHLPPDFSARSLRRDVLMGLQAPRKWLPPKWFYDKVGSELFEDITRLPEYYPTRTERAILHLRASEIIRSSGADTLIELGSGSSDKTRLLLDALGAQVPERAAYVALDVSEAALRSASAALVAQYPRLRVHAVRADFTHHLDELPRGGHRLVAFLGSTIGNLEPGERAEFLRDLRANLDDEDHFLLGADLVKSPDVLLPAYDDPAGVTAAFNLNVLDVLNRALDGDFDRSTFEHVAAWDPVNEWIEMRLHARHEVRARLRAIDLDVHFDPGEELRTEVSTKFRRDRLSAELTAAGFAPRGWWTDADELFSLSLWASEPGPTGFKPAADRRG